MRTLRLTQTPLQDGQHHVRVVFDDGGAPQEATAVFPFEVSEQDREDLRWYLEDYLEYPLDPAPKIAARIERRMAEVGRELFQGIFGQPDTAYLWPQVAEHLPDTRVVVSSEVEADAVLPWELLREPRTDAPLAVAAETFVRAQHQTARRARMPQPADGERIRVLLVISRPAGDKDVPFRSVASHLVRLSAEARETFQLDVLRPATFARLAEVLRQAKDRGEPYHVVHFDGHGAWLDVGAGGGGRAIQPGGLRYSSSLLSPARPGPHGYLLFEDPSTQDNQQLADGPALGGLLFETGVPVLVLNACQSAHADPATTPGDPEDTKTKDAHERVRSYGSLAQEVVDAGVAGVVAMRYSVYVVTAAQFLADMYAALLQGHPLGTAVTRGRKQLRDQPNREIAFEPRPLQDWVVPVVYEAAPLKLFPKPQRTELAPSYALRRETRGEKHDRPSVSGQRLPDSPDIGFFGRDETLLALDRAFNNHQVVLLHAYAGAGKTSTAAEFARWYQHTGGINGPVLFTSFEQHRTLPQVLDQLGEAFEDVLAAGGVQWLTLTDDERRAVALKVLRQLPVLWIWDNVEPVSGFPADTRSDWTKTEQAELLGFLREIRDTKAKVLLTSRRDERAWLGNLPVTTPLLPMPMTDRMRLARAMAERHGQRLTDMADWRPLLAYTQGNPLTVTVLVGQALRDRLDTRDQLEEFVQRLRAGEADLDDDQRLGRTRSLGASLTYGLDHSFTGRERESLALLHLFRDVVHIDVLRAMGDPETVGDAVVPVVRGLTRQASIGLLDRAAEIGLLHAFGDGFYGIHPALPWHLRALFARTHASSDEVTSAAKRAYTIVMADLGEAYLRQYMQQQGREVVIRVLRVEEANLLHAFRLAQANRWWPEVVGVMQALQVLYGHTGRRPTWARLVETVTADLTDPATDGPYPHKQDEESWNLLTEYRVGLARQARDYRTAQRLQRLLNDWRRDQAAVALAADPVALNDDQRRQLHNLVVGLVELGEILREQQQPGCLTVYQDALALFQRIGDRIGEAAVTLSLGRAYLEVAAVRDLAQALRWTQHSLDLRQKADQLSRVYCVDQLGQVHYERFLEAKAAGQPAAELMGHLRAAGDAFYESLILTPPDAVEELAVLHNHLGLVNHSADRLSIALEHYRTSIRYRDAAGDRYGAAESRLNAGVSLAARERFVEALEWIQAALRDYESYGDRAREDIADTQQLIDRIQQSMLGGQD